MGSCEIDSQSRPRVQSTRIGNTAADQAELDPPLFNARLLAIDQGVGASQPALAQQLVAQPVEVNAPERDGNKSGGTVPRCAAKAEKRALQEPDRRIELAVEVLEQAEYVIQLGVRRIIAPCLEQPPKANEVGRPQPRFHDRGRPVTEVREHGFILPHELTANSGVPTWGISPMRRLRQAWRVAGTVRSIHRRSRSAQEDNREERSNDSATRR